MPRPPAAAPTLDWAALPTFLTRDTFHVGRLPGVTRAGVAPVAPPEAMRDVSYEGPGLSVSACPDAWIQIARLGGLPTYALRRADGRPGRFLGVHALRGAAGATLLAEAVRRGLLRPAAHLAVDQYDDEFGRTGRMMAASLAEALAELGDRMDEDFAADAAAADPALRTTLEAWWDGTADEAAVADALAARVADARAALAAGAREAVILGPPLPDDGSDDQEDRLVLVAGWEPEAPLRAWWATHFRAPLTAGGARDAAISWLVEHASDLDGLWWHDDEDPIRLSAPRGVIVPRALAGWRASLVREPRQRAR